MFFSCSWFNVTLQREFRVAALISSSLVVLRWWRRHGVLDELERGVLHKYQETGRMALALQIAVAFTEEGQGGQWSVSKAYLNQEEGEDAANGSPRTQADGLAQLGEHGNRDVGLEKTRHHPVHDFAHHTWTDSWTDSWTDPSWRAKPSVTLGTKRQCGLGSAARVASAFSAISLDDRIAFFLPLLVGRESRPPRWIFSGSDLEISI